MSEKNLIYKSNALVQAAYSLSITEQKLLLSAITQVRRDSEITDEVLYEVAANTLSDMDGFSASNEYKILRQAAKRLYDRSITVTERPNGENEALQIEEKQFRWVQEIHYFKDQGVVRLRFSKPILPYLTELTGAFTKYKLQHVSAMRSSYGIRLYELLVQWRTSGEREIEIDWLRRQWELTKKYSSIRDLKKRVIEPAIADVNTHSDLWVKWGQRKTGRRVTHLQFKFGPKVEKKAVTNRQPTKAAIEAAARPGETYEDAALRMMEAQRRKA